MIGRSHNWNHLVLAFSLLRVVFAFTDLISLLIIGLFVYFYMIQACMFLGIYPFLDFQFDGVWLFIIVSHNPLYFCGVIVMSPLSFLILFVWTLFSWVNLVTSLSILFIISKSQLLFPLIFSIHSLVSISMSFSSLIFVISSYLYLCT